MADNAGVLARITNPGAAGTLRVDINDGVTYLLDPATDLGAAGVRRTTLEAANVDGATIAARSRPLTSALLVVHILPQASLAALNAAYAALKTALETPSTLRYAMKGWAATNPFLIDLDGYDSFPNLVGARLPWQPGQRDQWHADTLAIPVTRQPRSYGAGTYL